MTNELADHPTPPHLNIDKLVRTLAALSEEPTRLSRARLDEIFRALRFELPYTTSLINANFAFALFADAPRGNQDTTLNEFVVTLCKTLINPSQLDSLTQAVENYFAARDKTENAYAIETVTVVLETNPLDAFPEANWDDLRQLTLMTMEKIINEKLSRRVPGYKSQSVLELIKPFLQYRLSNNNLEKIKTTQTQIFKKWLTNVAHDGYEKINSEVRFTQILDEKFTAFTTLNHLVLSKSQSKASLARHIDRIDFSQKDKNKKMDALGVKLETFLSSTSVLAGNAGVLRGRLYDKCRKLFALAEKNPAVYQTEKGILAAQNKAYTQVTTEMDSIEKIITAFSSLEKNYAKNLLAPLFSRDNLARIRSILLTGMLGPEVKKRDMHSGQLLSVHEGGYPAKALPAIFSYLITQLQTFANQVSGLYSAKLKIQIEQTIHVLTTAQSQAAHEAEFAIMTSEALPAVAPEVEPPRTQPRTELPSEEPSVTSRSFGPPPVSRLDIPVPAATVSSEPIPQPPVPVPVPEPAPVPALEPIPEPKPEPARAPAPEPEVIQAPPAETVSPETPTPETEPEESFTLEPVRLAEQTATLIEAASETDLDHAEFPAIELEPVALKPSEPAVSPAVTDPGLVMMKHYELGDFSEPVHAAWKTMLIQSTSARPETDINVIAQEMAVKFHVICDLVQQVAAINEDMLSPENREMLVSIQTLLMAALHDPLEENNWTFFEGSRRNDVDRAITLLQN